MAQQIQANLLNEMVQWDAYIELVKRQIEEKQLEIKHDTEAKRKMISAWRKNLRVAAWKRQEIFYKVKAGAKNGYTSTLTLEDFEPKEIDINLTTAEYKKAKEAERD